MDYESIALFLFSFTTFNWSFLIVKSGYSYLVYGGSGRRVQTRKQIPKVTSGKDQFLNQALQQRVIG